MINEQANDCIVCSFLLIYTENVYYQKYLDTVLVKTLKHQTRETKYQKVIFL